MIKVSKRLLTILSCLCLMMCAFATISYGSVLALEYATEDGDASHIFEGATVHLTNEDGIKPAPVVWKEHDDGTLTYNTLDSYNAIYYSYANKLNSSFEIAGKVTVTEAGSTLDRQLSLLFGDDGSYTVGVDKMAMFAARGEDGNEANLNYTNGFRSKGFAWTAAAAPDSRAWALPNTGESMDFVLQVQDKVVTVKVNGKTYDSYTLGDQATTDDIAFGFYAHNVKLTLSDLYFGDIRVEGEYFTKDGDASHIFDGATIHLTNEDGIKPAPVVWKEHTDATLSYDTLDSYNAIYYSYANKLNSSFEIAGKVTVTEAGSTLDRQLSLLFGDDGSYTVGVDKLAMFAGRGEDGNEANLNYTNGFRSKGFAWTAAAAPDSRAWALPNTGESMDFVLQVQDKVVTVKVNGKTYDSYTLGDQATTDDIAFGFYAHNVKLTLSDLYFGDIRVEGEYFTKDGDASHIFDGATIHLTNEDGMKPAPVVWKEHTDATLSYDTLDSYNAIYYSYANKLNSSFEIAGKVTVTEAGSTLDRQLSLLFGDDGSYTVGVDKLAMFAGRGEDGNEANLNYTNGFRSKGFAWTAAAAPDSRAWALPNTGESMDFVLQVQDKVVTVKVNGKTYDSYTLGDQATTDDIAFGFYAHNVKLTLSDLYFGDIRVEGEYFTKDGDASHIFDGATIHLTNEDGIKPAPVVWKEHTDATLSYDTLDSYNAIYYSYANKLNSSFEIAGKVTVTEAGSTLDRQLSLLFGDDGSYTVGVDKLAMFAGRGEDGNEANLNYTNGFRSKGFAWTAAAAPDSRAWALPNTGESMDFVLQVQDKVVTVKVNGKTYDSYTLGDQATTDDIAFGFYAHNVKLTLSDLYFGDIRTEEKPPVEGEYATKDGDASHIFEGATVHLTNEDGIKPAPVVWKEHTDATLSYDTLDSYNAIYYSYANKLNSSFEIAGKVTVTEAGSTLDRQLSLLFGDDGSYTVGVDKLAMFAGRGEDGNEANLNYTNGFRSKGFAWTAAAAPDSRAWALPNTGESMDFVLQVQDKVVTVKVNGEKYASYTLGDQATTDDIAFGFYAHNVKLTLSDLYFGDIRTEEKPPVEGEYATKDGDASHIFEGATVHLTNEDGIKPAPVEWKEHDDGTLTYSTLDSYNAIYYSYANKLNSSFEIAGKVTVTEAGSTLDRQLSLLFGDDGSYTVGVDKMAMFAARGEDGNEANLNYTNGFRSKGFAWTAAAAPDSRAWALPNTGESMDFVLQVQDKVVTVKVNGEKYASYTLGDQATTDDIAFGFYAHNVKLTLSDLYFGDIRTEENPPVEGEFDTKDGDTSHIFEGATIHLNNEEGIKPAPVEWKEHNDGTLTYNTLDSYNAIYYSYANGLSDSYEISAKMKIVELGSTLDRQLSFIFGDDGSYTAGVDKIAMFAARGEDGNEANLNYTNGFRGKGFGWTAASDPEARNWTLPEEGKTVEVIVQVNKNIVTVYFDGKPYSSYVVSDKNICKEVAFGFYAHNIKVVLSDLYFGSLREHEGTADPATKDGTASAIMDGATVRLLNLAGRTPAPVIWNENADGSLTYDSLEPYNGILFDYGKSLGSAYEISGTLKVNGLRGLESEFAVVFGASDISGDYLQAAVFSSRDSSGKEANLNFKNGFRAAGVSWVASANPDERNWTLPEAGETVDFSVCVKDRHVTVILNGVRYASYYIEDTVNFDNVAWGFYDIGANVTVSNLYYGAIRQSNIDSSNAEEDDQDGYFVTRNPDIVEAADSAKTGANSDPNVKTGENVFALQIVLLAVILSGAFALVVKKKSLLNK